MANRQSVRPCLGSRAQTTKPNRFTVLLLEASVESGGGACVLLLTLQSKRCQPNICTSRIFVSSLIVF
jgi:hypothetical protein